MSMVFDKCFYDSTSEFSSGLPRISEFYGQWSENVERLIYRSHAMNDGRLVSLWSQRFLKLENQAVNESSTAQVVEGIKNRHLTFCLSDFKKSKCKGEMMLSGCRYNVDLRCWRIRKIIP